MRILAALFLTILTCAAAPLGFNRNGVNFGLVGWWPLNEGTGTTTRDFSGLAQTGNFTNSPAWTNGIIGKALAFNGTSSYVNLPSATFGTSITIACWMRRPWTSVAKYTPAFAVGYNSTAGIALLGTGSDTAYWLSRDFFATGNGYNDGQTPVVSAAPGTLADDTWHHVAAVLSSTVSIIYFDGVALSSRTNRVANVTAITAQPKIGGSTLTSDWNDGLIDDMRVYNRVLTAAEIKQLYGGGYGSQ